MAIGDMDELAGAGGQVHKLEGLNSLNDNFQLVGYVAAATKAGKGATVKKNRDGTGPFSIDDMLVYSSDPIHAPLLKQTPDNASRAMQMFGSILSYLGDSGEKLSDAQRVEMVQKLLHQGLKRPELKDELYMQLVKQTRGNGNSESRMRAWELMFLVAATMPPSKSFAGTVSAYLNARASDDGEQGHIQRLAQRAWNSLKRTSRAGARRMMPSAEEITASLADSKLSTIVFFCDDTFDNLDYEITTTVQEATGLLAASQQLEHYKTFTLFECRRPMLAKNAAPTEIAEDEYFTLDDNRFIADILVDLKMKNDKHGKEVTCKLVFRKRVFRKEEDEEINEIMFTQMSYIQCQHDFVQGHYPVAKEDAAQMCALQLAAEHASALVDDDAGMMMGIEKFITKQLLMTRPKDEWKSDVGSRYKAVSSLSKEEAKLKFLSVLRSLPYGMSIFFPCKRVEDPVGLLPPKLVIGVNFLGVHFFRVMPKEYLHSAELKDVVQFGSSSTAVFLKMKIADVAHTFQFETRQGAELCFSLQTHVNDIMTKRFIAAKIKRGEVDEEAEKNKRDKAFNPKYEQHLMQLQQSLEDSQNLVDAIQRKTDELRYAKEKAMAEIEDMSAELNAEREACDKISQATRSLEVVAQGNKQELEIVKASCLAAEQACAAAGAELAAIDLARYAQLEELLKERTEQLNKATGKNTDLTKTVTQLNKEKELADAKLKRVEKALETENKELREKLDGVSGNNKKDLSDKDMELNTAMEELAVAQAKLNEARDENRKFRDNTKGMELHEIKEMQADVERKAKQNETILIEQEKKIAEIEASYRNEQNRRKSLFNQLEDIRGKVRVYCRVRPALAGEVATVTVPNDSTVIARKEYMLDAAFGPESTQQEVFNDTKHCAISAVEGYNVCFLAYGQTGAGKTHTMCGTDKDPGFMHFAAKEMFYSMKSKSKLSFRVWFYMLELTSDGMTDLLLPPGKRARPPRMDVRKDVTGLVLVAGATTIEVTDDEHLIKLMALGHKARRAIKSDTSKSHLIMTTIIQSSHASTGNVIRSKLTVVDMAGSEKGKDPKNATALANLITILEDDNPRDPRVPYRDSRLTLMLSDCFGGNAKTVLMLNVAPTDAAAEETAATLELACHMTKVKNAVKKLEDNKDMQKIRSQIEYWKAQAGVPETNERLMDWAGYEEIEEEREEKEGGGVGS